MAGFFPLDGKTYQFALLIRGVGNSVGKQITMGVYKNPVRVEFLKTLTEDWTLHITDGVKNDDNDFNIYVHGVRQGATMVLGEQFEVAGLFVVQTD